ncbi:MAG: muconolactone Delta-isomerase family protein [Thermodesulfobacteriota bacterium]
MLFLLDVDIDYGRLGEKRDQILAEEWGTSRQLYAEGTMLRIWRKANAQGAVAVWDVPDHETLNEKIRAMPLYPYFRKIRAIPLVPHPKFPQWAKPDPDRG